MEIPVLVQEYHSLSGEWNTGQVRQRRYQGEGEAGKGAERAADVVLK